LLHMYTINSRNVITVFMAKNMVSIQQRKNKKVGFRRNVPPKANLYCMVKYWGSLS
jgi:hypothetical protein